MKLGAPVLALACGLLFSPLACRPRAPVKGSDVPSLRDESWRARVPASGPATPFHYPTPAEARLANGFSVLTVHHPASLVAAVVVVKHGQSSVAPGKSGLAALTNRMLTEGTQSRSAHELALAAETLGSDLDFGTGRDDSHLGVVVLRPDLDRAVALLGEVTQAPRFSATDLERVREEWLASLVQERQSPERLASLAGLRLLLGPDQGAPVTGSLADVSRITEADLRSFHQRCYRPRDSALIVVGDIAPGEVMVLAEAHFGSWKEPAAEVVPAQDSAARLDPSEVVPPGSTSFDASAPGSSKASLQRVALVDRPGAGQSAIFVAQRFPPRSAPGHEAREILNAALGGLFTSRLNHNLREKHGYTYGASSTAVATRHFGAWVAATTVEVDATASALTEIKRELLDLASGARPLTSVEIERGRTALVHVQAARLERTETIALDTAALFVEGLPIDYYASYLQTLATVTPASIEREIRQQLTPDALLYVVVGDRARVETSLRQGFGVLGLVPQTMLE